VLHCMYKDLSIQQTVVPSMNSVLNLSKPLNKRRIGGLVSLNSIVRKDSGVTN
jgi:hypothetical protein